jgi:hypothetical protein
VRVGVKIQVAVVQTTIKIKGIFALPSALIRLRSGDENEAKKEERQNR